MTARTGRPFQRPMGPLGAKQLAAAWSLRDYGRTPTDEVAGAQIESFLVRH